MLAAAYQKSTIGGSRGAAGQGPRPRRSVLRVRQLGSGDEIGGYRIEAMAGRGGMGLVYRARQRRPDRIVAIKVIAPELAADPDFRARFEQESATAAEIEHPNVIPVYEVGEDDGLLFIAMRFVPGVDLGGLLRQTGRLPSQRVAHLIAQVADALDAAHARGLVHRDVKPGNILVATGDHVYLTDFGLTKRASDSGGRTKTGMFVGTVDYIAPEQVEGRRIDARADVYALGCVTYQALSGTVPFPRDSDIAKIFAHVNDSPPPLRDIPLPLAAAVFRAMAKRPADRFQSAGDFGRAVSAGAAGRTDAGGDRTVATGDAASADAHAPTEIAGPVPAALTQQAAAVDSPSPSGGPGATPQRRSTRPWAFAAGAVLLVAVIGVAVAVAAGGSGRAPTTSTTTAGSRSTATSTTPTNAFTPAPKPTSAQIFSAVNPNGGLAVSVTGHKSGSCFGGSIAIQRSDAFRCTVGNDIEDPCFMVNQTQVLCPDGGPWTNQGILVNVPSLPTADRVKGQGTSGQPWAIQLAGGSQCLAITGASNVIANQRLNFECTGGVGLYGNVQRSGSAWMIYVSPPHSGQIALRPIATAWF
jgi:Protein kinase domain